MTTTNVQTKRKRPKIAIPAEQFEQIAALADVASASDSPVGQFLHGELTRAHLIKPGRRRAHVVQIGSHVTYRDDKIGETREVTLSLPANADIKYGRISVLTPVGAALLGMAAGQSISYPAPGGSDRQLTVLTVVNII